MATPTPLTLTPIELTRTSVVPKDTGRPVIWEGEVFPSYYAFLNRAEAKATAQAKKAKSTPRKGQPKKGKPKATVKLTDRQVAAGKTLAICKADLVAAFESTCAQTKELVNMALTNALVEQRAADAEALATGSAKAEKDREAKLTTDGVDKLVPILTKVLQPIINEHLGKDSDASVALKLKILKKAINAVVATGTPKTTPKATPRATQKAIIQAIPQATQKVDSDKHVDVAPTVFPTDPQGAMAEGAGTPECERMLAERPRMLAERPRMLAERPSTSRSPVHKRCKTWKIKGTSDEDSTSDEHISDGFISPIRNGQNPIPGYDTPGRWDVTPTVQVRKRRSLANFYPRRRGTACYVRRRPRPLGAVYRVSSTGKRHP